MQRLKRRGCSVRGGEAPVSDSACASAVRWCAKSQAAASVHGERARAREREGGEREQVMLSTGQKNASL